MQYTCDIIIYVVKLTIYPSNLMNKARSLPIESSPLYSSLQDANEHFADYWDLIESAIQKWEQQKKLNKEEALIFDWYLTVKAKFS